MDVIRTDFMTEGNHGAELLTGYTGDDMKGEAALARLSGTDESHCPLGAIWARHRGEVAWDEASRR